MSDHVILPRHKQQELLAAINACRALLPIVQRIVTNVTEIAIRPELVRLRTETITDATTAIERTKRIDEQLAALAVYIEHLERMTLTPPNGSVM